MSPTDRRARWQRLLAEHQTSGLSVAAWCRHQGLEPQSVYYWRKRLTTPEEPQPQWVALAPVTPVAPLTLRVGAVTVEVAAGFDPALLAAVLAVLERR